MSCCWWGDFLDTSHHPAPVWCFFFSFSLLSMSQTPRKTSCIYFASIIFNSPHVEVFVLPSKFPEQKKIRWSPGISLALYLCPCPVFFCFQNCSKFPNFFFFFFFFYHKRYRKAFLILQCEKILTFFLVTDTVLCSIRFFKSLKCKVLNTVHDCITNIFSLLRIGLVCSLAVFTLVVA